MKSIVHVGHTKTSSDMKRICQVLEWLTEKGFKTNLQSDFMDLNEGRDFLKESKVYDIVVLHFIFRGGCNSLGNLPQLKISDKASWSEWRKRLITTGARFVFAFGGMAEVGGTYICNLNGYNIHKIRTESLQDDELWIFEKILI